MRPLHELLSDLPDTLFKAPRWLVALSGGADSVALLYALTEVLAEQPGPALSAIHVQHGLHPDAEAWQALCQQHCDAVGISLSVHRPQICKADKGLEAAAREARYQAFEAELQAGDVLFTAHHQDDQVETVLLRLLRGAGPRGLSAIPKQRALGQGEVHRPFLALPRASLERWVRDRGLAFVEDPANQNLDFDRNYLRHKVLPVIAARWPGYRNSVQRAAELQAQVARQLVETPLPLDTTLLGEPSLLIDQTLSGEALTSQLHQWLMSMGLASPDRRRLTEFCRQALTAAPDRQPELPLDSGCLRVWRGQMIRVREPSPTDLCPTGLVVGEAITGPWGAFRWQLDSSEGVFHVGEPVQVMLSGALDTLSVPGRPTKTAHRYLQEAGVPPWWRDRMPVLCRGTEPCWILPVGPLAARDRGHSPGAPLMRPIWVPPDAL